MVNLVGLIQIVKFFFLSFFLCFLIHVFKIRSICNLSFFPFMFVQVPSCLSFTFCLSFIRISGFLPRRSRSCIMHMRFISICFLPSLITSVIILLLPPPHYTIPKRGSRDISNSTFSLVTRRVVFFCRLNIVFFLLVCKRTISPSSSKIVVAVVTFLLFSLKIILCVERLSFSISLSFSRH